MNPLAILADDLTGAADTGVAFAAHGVTLIALSARAPAADVLVLSTESRHLPREQTIARVRAAAAQVAHATLIYKKIDSTLRGAPAAELRAVLDALGETRAIVAPAFPAQGRTTLHSRQYVDGVPLEQSAFAREIVTSDLRVLFGEIAALTPLTLEVVRGDGATFIRHLATGQVCLADAETEDDLAAIAGAALQARVRVWCGSAGLARALAQQAIVTPVVSPPRVPARPRGTTLIVAGSRHPRTRAQIKVLRAQGVPIVQADARVLTAEAEAGIVATVDDVCARSARVCGLIPSPAEAPMGGMQLAMHLAEIVRRVVQRGGISRLVLTGGDIAAAVCRALEAEALWLHGEIEAGVPYGVLLGGSGAGIVVVTKAGGFGQPETLLKAARQ